MHITISPAPLTPPSIHLQRSGIPRTALPSDITTFPFETECPDMTALDIHKQGSLPVYFTAWQQYGNNHPAKVDRTFSVHTSFETNGRTVTRLTAGEPVTLRIDIDVKTDVDYVMIEARSPLAAVIRTRHNHMQIRRYTANTSKTN